MRYLKKNRILLVSLTLFVFINVGLYFFIYGFHSLIPFDKHDYFIWYHHYFVDQSSIDQPFNFFRAIDISDAPWYLRIASEGYPKNPQVVDISKKTIMDGLSYAYFPVYPLLLSFVNFLIQDIELTAFYVANLLLIVNFI